MNSRLLLAQNTFAKFFIRYRAMLIIPMLIGNLSIGNSHAANCDIVSAVSVKILKIVTTTTSASISWKDGHSNGNRYFCYGSTPPKTCPDLSASRKTNKIEVLNNLIPQTKYYYRFYGTWGSKTTNTVGTFIADGSSCQETTTNLIIGQVGDGNGTPLEHVRVSLSSTAGGEAIETDTTISTGDYILRIPASGSYFLNFTYPTFPSPAPEPISLGDNSKWPGMKKISSFYQVGGTIMLPSKDLIKGVTVTLVNTTNPSMTYTTTTDFDGHYNFPANPGSYTLTASYMGSKLPSPFLVNVIKSSEKVAPLTLSGTTGTIQKAKLNTRSSTSTNSGIKEFRVDGIQIENQSSQIRTFQK